MKNSKNESGVLRLKLISSDLELAEEEFALGTLDLDEVLSKFTERIEQSQKEKYKNYFFGGVKANSKTKQNDNNQICKPEVQPGVSKSNKTNMPTWLKKIYKNILIATHPDKYINFPIESIKEKFTDIYTKAVEASECGDWGMLLLCAYETNIDFENKQSYEFITNSIKQKQENIDLIKSKMGYQWYHVPDSQRLQILENLLKQMGYSFSSEKLQNVVKSRSKIKRKVGTRPQKINVKQRKIK